MTFYRRDAETQSEETKKVAKGDEHNSLGCSESSSETLGLLNKLNPSLKGTNIATLAVAPFQGAESCLDSH